VAGGWWLVAGGWWLVAGGWWLVAGGWWLVAGGWWLVAGEVVDICYPAWRELGRFAVKDPPSKVSEGVTKFWGLSWGKVFPDIFETCVFFVML
jgi:hypothetical protein